MAKLIGLEETIDALVEKVVKSIKKEVAKKENITVAIKHQDISKRKMIGERTIIEPVFLLNKDDMIPFTLFWDDFELFKFPYIDLDFYIKSKIMQWQGENRWSLIWFNSLPPIFTQYNTKKLFKKLEKEITNE